MTGIMVAITGAIPSGSGTSGGGGGGGGGGALAVAANATLTQGNHAGGPMVNCSPPIILTPSGGTGPYSLSWALLSGPDFPKVVTGSGPWTTTFSFNTPAHIESLYRATVTDNVGATETVDVTVIANPFA